MTFLSPDIKDDKNLFWLDGDTPVDENGFRLSSDHKDTSQDLDDLLYPHLFPYRSEPASFTSLSATVNARLSTEEDLLQPDGRKQTLIISQECGSEICLEEETGSEIPQNVLEAVRHRHHRRLREKTRRTRVFKSRWLYPDSPQQRLAAWVFQGTTASSIKFKLMGQKEHTRVSKKKKQAKNYKKGKH
jgi:hypothetical protein